MKHKVHPILSVAALIAGSLAALATPAAAAVGDHSVATTSSVTVATGTPIQPFADAVISGTGDMEGVSIYIETGHEPTIDLLSATTNPSGITEAYDATTGLLRLRGTASIADYQTAVRSITYSQTSETEGTRGFLIVAAPVLYLEESGNLYEFVDVGSNITWADARTAANDRTFGSSSGHLVNITSAAENTVANTEALGDTWIGATDQATEGTWVWADGPEADEVFWSGEGSDSGGAPVSGRYNNWSGAVEPNDSGNNEDFAHLLNGTGQWNDFPGGAAVTGYLVEYEVADIGTLISRVSLTIETPVIPTPPVCVRTLTDDYADVSGFDGQLARLYMATFLRQPDAPGFDYWSGRAEAGLSIWSIAEFFAISPEFNSTYGSLADADFMDLMYDNIMCRSADSSGKEFWIGELNSDSLSRAEVLLLFADSPEFRGHTASS